MRIVVSMACLLRFGTQLEDELPQRALQHKAFRDYKLGKVDRSEALSRIASKYGLATSKMEDLLLQICNSCELDEELMSLVSKSGMKVIGWVDIPAAEWGVVSEKFAPQLEAFDHLVTELPMSSSEPDESMVVVDHDVERASVLNCKRVKAIVFTSKTKDKCSRFFARMHKQSVFQAGRDYLNRNAPTASVSNIEFDSGKQIDMVDYFAPSLAATLLSNASRPLLASLCPIFSEMASLIKASRAFGFQGVDFSLFPPDTETLAVSTTAMLQLGLVHHAEASKILDMIVDNVNDEGVLLLYFDDERPRVDQVTLVNIMFFAYLLGMEDHPVIRHQELLVQDFLLSGGYDWGTKYYAQPETFLFHYGRLLHCFGHRVPRYEQMVEATKTAVINSIGSTSAPVDLAKRIMLCSMLDIHNQVDLDMLVQTQNSDGSWPNSDVYVLLTTKGRLFNATLQQAYIMAALGM